MGVLQEARSRVVYVQDSPSNIADFLGDYLEESGVVEDFNDEMRRDLEKLIMRKFGNLPDGPMEVLEGAVSMGAGLVIGLGFVVEKFLVSLIPGVGPAISGIQDVLRVPEIARSLAKRLITILFDIGEDVADRIFPNDKAKDIAPRILDRFKGGGPGDGDKNSGPGRVAKRRIF